MEIRKLNTLRGLAAFIVLIAHFSDATQWLGTSLGGRAGQYGVMIFFMLSGFLMSYLYINKDFNITGLQKYALARIGRVVPLFVLVVVFSYVLQKIGIDVLYTVTNSETLLSLLLFMDGEGVLWTIAPEMQFYLIFAGIWFLASWRVGYVYLLIFAILIIIFLTNFPRPHGHLLGIAYDFNIIRSLPYFLIGVLFGKHYTSLKIPEYLKSSWFILTILLIFLMYPDFTPVTSVAKHRMWLDFGVLLVVAAVFFSIVFLVPDDNIIFANKVGDFIGKISYSLYLLHMPILIQLNQLEVGVEVKLFVFILVSVIVSYLSYKLIEIPSSKLIRGLVINQTNSKDFVEPALVRSK